MSVEKCKSSALWYVSLAVKTSGQVRDYLAKKEYTPEEIDAALEMLIEYKYVDDAQYCRDYYMLACRKGRGRRRIEQDLERKKISRSVIRDTLDDFLSEENPDYEDVVRETLTEKERAMALGKKMVNEQRASGKPLDRAFCAKVGRRLTSQGYGGDTIYSVIGMVMRQSEKEDRDERSI